MHVPFQALAIAAPLRPRDCACDSTADHKASVRRAILTILPLRLSLVSLIFLTLLNFATIRRIAKPLVRSIFSNSVSLSEYSLIFADA